MPKNDPEIESKLWELKKGGRFMCLSAVRIELILDVFSKLPKATQIYKRDLILSTPEFKSYQGKLSLTQLMQVTKFF